MAQLPTSPQIKAWAREIGFDLVGISEALPLDAANAQAWRDYLDQSRHASMHYLARTGPLRLDPRQFVPQAQSIICTATNYYSPDPPRGPKPHDPDKSPPGAGPRGRIARYARFGDYHDLIRHRLHLLKERIAQACHPKPRLRCCVDTAPLAEKYHAARAGIGWIGKNSLLLHPTFGSYLLLGEIVTDLPLEPDQPTPDHCRQCTRCLDACPTAALTGPRCLDPRRCLAYWTTETEQLPPPDIARLLPPRLFGCDTCQDACPFNQHPTPTSDPDRQPHPQWTYQTLADLVTLSDAALKERFAGSAIGRATPNHLRQLAQLALKKAPNPHDSPENR